MPTRHTTGHFGGGLHRQSLDWYWQTKQYRKIHIQKLNTNTVHENKHAKSKYKSNKVDNLKNSKTKTTLVQPPLTTLGQETRWAYFTMITHMGPKTHTGLWFELCLTSLHVINLCMYVRMYNLRHPRPPLRIGKLTTCTHPHTHTYSSAIFLQLLLHVAQITVDKG